MSHRTVVTCSSNTRRIAHDGLQSFVPPWQAMVMLVILTLGATVRAFPESIQPFAQYAMGIVHAAHELRSAPPANSPAYLGQ